MYLQLADNGQKKAIGVSNPFIYVPSFLFERYGINNPIPGQEGMFIREDWFDSLDPKSWDKMIRELARYQPSGVSEGEHLQDRASRKKKREEKKNERKEEKAEKKQNKALAKTQKQKEKTEKQKAKGEKKATKRANRKAVFENIGGTFGGILNGVAGAFGVNIPGGAPDPETETQDPRFDAAGNLISKKWYNNPVVWVVGGIVVAGAVGGGIYYATRTKPADKKKAA